MSKPTVYHIPVCPFCQRLEIILELKGLTGAVNFEVIDITKPRDPELLRKSRGTTALPIIELPDGEVLKESLVILRYLDEEMGVPVAQADPYRRAVENMMIAKEGPFTMAGYMMVMNQKPDQSDVFKDKMLAVYRDLNDFLNWQNPTGTYLFDDFGLAEAVFTPMFMRFWFLDYYEGFDLPSGGEYDRVRKWREACLAHPAAQQVGSEEIVKVYYDYAKGAGNGALLAGCTQSSFSFETDWRSRPMPPKDKYNVSATDAELGLI